MSILLFENNFSTTLATSIGASDTSATLVSASGLPTPGANEYFKLSFTDSTGVLNEIVNVTSLSGATCTIVRGQEGTTAQAWAAGTITENRWTAGSAQAVQQIAQAQGQQSNYAADTGSVNAIIATFSPAVTSHIIGMPLRVLIGHTNTGATTFNPGPSAVAVVTAAGGVLNPSDLVQGEIATLIYNGVNYQANPALASFGSPSGAIVAWPASTPPAGWLECNGQSTAGYSALAAVCGAYVPDLRGYFVRGWDHGVGIDIGRALLSTQQSQLGYHEHTVPISAENSSSTSLGHGGGGTTGTVQSGGAGGTSNYSETRGINVALMWIIKT